MKQSTRQLLKRIKYWMEMIFLPHLAFLRLREKIRGRTAKGVRKNLPTDSLPKVTLIPVGDKKDLQATLLRIYKKNSSPFVFAPKSRRALKRYMETGTEYYLVANSQGEIVGGRGFRPLENMFCHFVVDYKHRSSGYGLSTTLALEQLKAAEGFTEMRGKVFRDNRRMMSTYLSMGYEIEEEQNDPQFFSIVKFLNKDEELNND